MQRRDAIAALRAQSDRIRALGATALYLFGSTARDEATAASDLDLFLDYDNARRFSLIELVGIKHVLEERLGVRVDLTENHGVDCRAKR
jgi:predicted nucleotidyltransferase